MFDKHKFNNYVIINRIAIRSAQAQVINKMVRKLRKLQSIHDKQPKENSNTLRIRRATTCLEHLKKMKPIDVMCSVLLLESKPTAVLTNGQSLPETQAIALLALHKKIEGISKAIRSELNLDENNLTWREEMIKTSKRKAKKEETSKKQSERLELKKSKEVDRKRREWMDKNNFNSSENINNEQIKSTDLSDTQEDEVAKIVPEKILKNNLYEKENEEKEIEEIRALKEEANELHVNSKKANLTARESCERKLSQDHLKCAAFTKEVSKKVTTNDIVYTPDPFFLTETGLPYPSVALAPPFKAGRRYGDFEENTDSSDDETRAQNFRKHGRYHTEYAKSTEGRFKHKFGKRVDVTPTNNQQNSEELESLHPSWAAKKRLKPVICKPAGKKVVFNEDD